METSDDNRETEALWLVGLKVALRQGWVWLRGYLKDPLRVIHYTFGFLVLANLWPLVAASMLPLIVFTPVIALMFFAYERKLTATLGYTFLLAVCLPFYMAALGAFFRAPLLFIHDYIVWLPESLVWDKVPEIRDVMDMWCGMCGTIFMALLFVPQIRWLQRELEQMRNLATSKAASAALGLIELQGIYERAGRDAPIPEAEPGRERGLRPFYLKDDSGRILVDARGAVRKAGEFSSCFIHQPLSEVEFTISAIGMGTVYVVGTVEVNPAAPPDATGSDRLVVRRGTTRRLTRFERMMEWTGRVFNQERRDHTYVDVFFVGESQRSARVLLWQTFWRVMAAGLGGLLLFLWLTASRCARLSAGGWQEFFQTQSRSVTEAPSRFGGET